MNRSISILLIVSLLALSLGGCADNSSETFGGQLSSAKTAPAVVHTEVTPAPAPAPAPAPVQPQPTSELPQLPTVPTASQLLSRKDFGRATLIDMVLMGSENEIKFPTGLAGEWADTLINGAVNTALNGLFGLIRLLAKAPLKRAMAKNPTQLVFEFQGWSPDDQAPPTDSFPVNLWIVNTPKSTSPDQAEINPISATGSLDNPASQSIATMQKMIAKEEGGKLVLRTQESSVLKIRFYIGDYPVTVPIHNAEIKGDIQPAPNGGVIFTNGHLKGSLIDTNFRSFIYSLSDGCPASCIDAGLDDAGIKSSCEAMNLKKGFQCGIAVTKDAFKSLSKGLDFGKFSCLGFLAFCNPTGMAMVDALQDAADQGIGGHLKFTVDLALEGRPIVITGVAPTKVIPPVE